MASRKKASLEVRFSPNVELISHVRRFVSTFYEQVIGDPEVASRVALTTHELLENAVKYSTDGETRTTLEVDFDPVMIVSVRTWNRTDPAHLKELTDTMDEMAKAYDPMVFYQQAMRRSAKRVDGSGLGLARIRAEADMVLNYSFEADFVVIHAQINLDAERVAS